MWTGINSCITCSHRHFLKRDQCLYPAPYVCRPSSAIYPGYLQPSSPTLPSFGLLFHSAISFWKIHCALWKKETATFSVQPTDWGGIEGEACGGGGGGGGEPCNSSPIEYKFGCILISEIQWKFWICQLAMFKLETFKLLHLLPHLAVGQEKQEYGGSRCHKESARGRGSDIEIVAKHG